MAGLTPKQNSTGGKDRLDRITKQGDSYVRHLLVIGACSPSVPNGPLQGRRRLDRSFA
ncbi:transposase [Bradyrhizobium sp. IC4060]|uniref:transposase n=1 Tax=Bradyrhizobium sp. IC4061 TaxID=2793808 RepID=UPI002A2F79F2|nr:transposase [Bradyrhizobium sp. IC4060]MCA1488769.1 transposase [Bradyrhizobium sp. IC4061]